MLQGRKTQGVISIFLIIILLPMLTMGVVLIDAARARSAKMIAQQAADIAAMSVLTYYNTLLKDAFGLFALADSYSAQSRFDAYLKASLNAGGGTDIDSYSGMIQYLMQKSIFGGGAYAEMDFVNLYNFDVQNVTLEMLYNLADMDVLESQIVEYAKFRGIIPIMRRLSVLSQTGTLKNEIEQAERSLNAMSEKIKIDEKEGADAEREIGKLSKAVEIYNGTGIGSAAALRTAESKYYSALSAYLAGINDDGEDSYIRQTNYANAKNELMNKLEDVRQTYEDMKRFCENAIEYIDAVIPKYRSLGNKYQSFADGTAQKQLSEESFSIIAEYEKCKEEINKLLTSLNETDVANIIFDAKRGVGVVEEKAAAAASDNGSKSEAITAYRDKVSNEIKKLKNSYLFNNPLIKADATGFKENDAKKIGEKANDKCNEKKDESNKEKLTDEEYLALPSGNKDIAEYRYEDMALDRNNGLKTVNFVSGSLGSFMKDYISSTTNDLLVYSYILGTFKTRITGNVKIKYDEPPVPLKKYHTEWRYGSPVTDLRGYPIAKRITRFRNAEVEYIFAGNKSEAVNEAAVYSWIYTTRLANNLIAVYLDKNGANAECLSAASAAAAACGFVVPVSVFHWIFMIAWAAGETSLEMIMLIDEGYSIPLLKTKNNLYIEHIWDIARLMDGTEGLGGKTPENAFLLSYEDYLVIMLAFVGSETRLSRTADLIQVNMGALGKSGFRMNEAYAYFRTSSDIGIKYLFSNTSQFAWGYNVRGIRFTNTIYKGY